MSEQTYTKADLDAAIAAALKPLQESIGALEGKRDELISENRKLKRGAEIKPEDLQAAEDRADKAEARVAELDKSVKALTGERDKAVKALEAEQGAARGYALEAELAGAIAEGNVVPALAGAFKAMMQGQAKADLVDGRYAVMIGDKPARDHIKAYLDSDEGKAFKMAPANGGGGAPGGKGGATAKVADSIESIPLKERQAFFDNGGIIQSAA